MHRVLEGIIDHGRIAPAYLFVGPPGSAKAEAAQWFADRLGCKSVDRVMIQPDGASVKIDQILDLQRFTRHGPAMSSCLVAMVNRADEMTAEAAAAFLKTLEEPAPGVTFILLVEKETRLPDTILSRCQKILFGEALQEWQPRAELAPWYEELLNIKQKNMVELFELAGKLEKEKERIEDLLYELIFYARHKLGNLRLVRVLLEAVKNIKKKAGLKLALEVACLQMGEA